MRFIRAFVAFLILTLAIEASYAVVLVQGTISTPNEGERNYSARVTRNTEKWLSEAGISCVTTDDEHISDAILGSSSVIILPYNPHLPDTELATLRRAVARGCKLLVFYSSDERLASLMHVKLGKYTAATDTHQWHSFSFNRYAPKHMPKRIYQSSNNIRPIYPTRSTGKTIAYWESSSGKRTGDPAWVRTENGYWMSHVLLDCDVRRKKVMLLAMIGAYDPLVWKTAAIRFREQAGKIGSFESASATLQWINQQKLDRSRRSRTDAAISDVLALSRKVADLQAEERFADAALAALSMEATLTKAYALAHTPFGTLRGVWDHESTGLYPGDWNKTCKTLSDHGINAIFPNMLWPGQAHYPSKVLPRSEIARTHGDQVKQCIAAARKHSIAVHIWKVCWRLDGAPPALIAQLEADRRLQVDNRGNIVPWLCPTDPRNREYELAAIQEIIKNYDVDGIHLDYVRYRNSSVCYCAGCKTRFEKQIRKSVSRRDWDTLASSRMGASSSLATPYRKWRTDQITMLVKETHSLVKKVDPHIQVSAAVFGGYPKCIPSVGQDWGEWLKKGYVDFVCPMNYTDDMGKFTEYLQSQLKLNSADRRVFPGIGVTTDHSRLTPSQTIAQIHAAESTGADGYVIFELNEALYRETMPYLKLGVTDRR